MNGNKSCPYCGQEVDEGAKFCPKCGNQIPVNNQTPVENQAYSYQPPEPPKKKSGKGCIIALIVAAVIFFLVLIITIGVGIILKSSNSSTSKYEYTEGTVENGVYINEWANLSFEVTSDWPQASEVEYSQLENEANEVGFLSQDLTTGRQLCIGYEELSALTSGITENDYLDILKEGLVDNYETMGLEADFNTYTDISIADQNYRLLRVDLYYGSAYQYMCVKKIDNYIVYITITSYDENDIINTLEQIKPVR